MSRANSLSDPKEKKVFNGAALYRVIWRWHFYAGVFCVPFVTVLALSGSVYLFKPQIDAFFDRPFTHMALSGPAHALDHQVATALTAVPNARIKGVELRNDPADAARVHVIDAEGREQRVLIRPDTLEVLKIEAEKWRLSTLMHDIHGSLLLGDVGAIALELAGAWAIVMVLTGLCASGGRATPLASLAFCIPAEGAHFCVTCTPSRGSMFHFSPCSSSSPVCRGRRSGVKRSAGLGGITQQQQVKLDWTTGPSSAKAQRLAAYNEAPPARAEVSSEHEGHEGHEGMKHGASPATIEGFGRIAALVRDANLADPVMLIPPSEARPVWQVRSDAQNRPLRETLHFDAKSFNLVRREEFSDKPIIDKVVGVGVAAHEGHLFGFANQLLGLFTALSFLVLVVTSVWMWLRRRPIGALGAPPPLATPPRLAPALILLVVMLGILLPTLGCSLGFVIAFEFLASRFMPVVARWLGISPRVAAG